MGWWLIGSIGVAVLLLAAIIVLAIVQPWNAVTKIIEDITGQEGGQDPTDASSADKPAETQPPETDDKPVPAMQEGSEINLAYFQDENAGCVGKWGFAALSATCFTGILYLAFTCCHGCFGTLTLPDRFGWCVYLPHTLFLV